MPWLNYWGSQDKIRVEKGSEFMKFVPYVYDEDNNQIPVSISHATKEDLESTNDEPVWQTSWTEDYLTKSGFECYAVKVQEELIALGAYEVKSNQLFVYIVYMESEPHSNPTLTNRRKYRGIGRVLIAQGIRLSVDSGFGGDVVLRAKTPQLENHYIEDYGAVKLPTFDSSAPRYLIADDAAKRIFFSYLK